jgi:hypothetical protein
LIPCSIFSITSSAMATVKVGKLKVPKVLCLEFGSFSDYHQLSFKAIGGLSDYYYGKLKTYAITGNVFNYAYGPVSGSAYIIPGTATLHATYTGMFGMTDYNVASYELFLDANGVGTIYARYVYDAGTHTNTDTVYISNCDFFSVILDEIEGAVYTSTPPKQ